MLGMKTKSLVSIAQCAAIALWLGSPIWAAGENTTSATPSAQIDANSKKSRPALEKGMTAEAIIQSIGKPASVSLMKSPEGKAETWIYRRLVDQQTFQSADSQTTVPTFIGMAADGPMLANSVIPVYRMKHRKTYQVTSLLMFEDKLVLAKQWREVDESYAD
jgi:hypothetical protein